MFVPSAEALSVGAAVDIVVDKGGVTQTKGVINV